MGLWHCRAGQLTGLEASSRAFNSPPLLYARGTHFLPLASFLHRLRGANPAYTVDELVYQIQTAKATVLFIHPGCLKVGLEGARKAGIRDDRVVLFDGVPGDFHVTVSQLVKEGLTQPRRYVEPQLKPGEGKTKLALLLFSSGTTGRPKAVMIPHYAVIANCVQMKQCADIRDAAMPNDKKLYSVGDVALGGMSLWRCVGVYAR